ncbi:growth-regulating factor 9 isoform X3 [Prunus persica]|uniref:growth-regulating factor 9 isoform X3 n=1 Tax=Prunus persica TaxID=3760 RepID=UPI0009AB8424|nr:growth-regulating factor 9 isoform X3 [Prunus persica]
MVSFRLDTLQYIQTQFINSVKQFDVLVMTMEEEGGGKVKLGLGIGVDCYGDDHNGTEEVVVGKKKKKYGGGGLTASQLHELEQQALIYKHFAANLPVPFHLVLPIWKSVAASFGSSNAAAINRQYPSFVGFSATGFDYRDHEPGRCRRTDGKKWRCNKNVVPDQKYCQQHMHRGRQRSRKPVENSEVASPSSTKTPKNSEIELGNSKTNLQISTPKGLQLMAQSYNYVSVSQGTTMASSGYHECKKNIRPVTTTSIANIPANRSATSTNPAAVATTTIAGPTTTTNSSTNENSLNIGVKYNSSNHAGGNCMIRGSSMNVVNISPGLGFSPKSVLQGCNGLYFDNGSGVELEPGRCRRTDGKKWRCRRDVLPDQKYCGQHIHRGAKRQMKDVQPVAVPSSSAAAMNTTRLSRTTAICRKTNCAIPNTNLSISIPANPPPGRNDERINSSSDSDTTLTDTSLTACDSSHVSS